MTIATIITGGYGKFSSVHLMPTLGYGPGNTTIQAGPLRGFGIESEEAKTEAKAQASSSSWNPNWSEDYGPDYRKALAASKKDVQQAVDDIVEAEYIPTEFADLKETAHSEPKQTLVDSLMLDEERRVILLIEYYAFVCWKQKDDEEIILLMTMM